MSLAKSRLTSQGRISVPAEIRRKLGLGPGSVLEWEQVGEQMVIRRVGTYTSEDVHQALFSSRPAERSLDALKQGRARDIRKRHSLSARALPNSERSGL
jgi:AbrB family looped-hinge helix DNA binding protein